MFDAKTKILVADDMATIRLLVVKLLSDLGFTDITEVADGEAALKSIQHSDPPYGLVISDWNMPKITGVDLVRKLRADPKFARTPFLLVTTENETARVIEAAKAGVDDYIVKPFTRQILWDKLASVYKRRSTK